MVKISLIVLSMFLVLNARQVSTQTLDIVPVKRVMSLDLREKPLQLVAEEIYKQTGCKVVFDEKWNDLPLSGQYAGVTVEDFFWRSLRKDNVSLFYDDKSNVANLHFFGDKNIRRIDIDTLASRNAANGEVSEEIKELHSIQRTELERLRNDPEAIDSLSGMKLVDIRELHSTQRAELERSLNDPEAIDSLSDMKLVDIQELHSTQRAELERSRNDPEAIDSLSGMKLVDIQELHSIQRVESERSRNDPETIDPLSGMTNGEIKRLHDVQRTELEQLKKKY